MNRRSFLQSIAASSVIANIAQGAPAPKIRCGILGIDHAHGIDLLKVALKSPDFEVVGVCEPDASVRKSFEANPALQNVRWLSNDDLLKDESIQMIAIESGVSRLLDLAHLAIAAGKHIHLDKPAGASLPSFQALLESAEKKNLLVQMGYMFRYNPGFDFIRRAVREGWLGDIYAIHASMCTDLDAFKRARIGAFSGGIMFELACHLIDIIVLLLGAPDKVTAHIRHDSPAQDALADNTLAVLEYPRALVSVESAAMEPSAFASRRFKVSGTRGTITLNPLEPPAARLVLREAVGEYAAGSHTIPFEDLPRHAADLADLAACIRGERTFEYAKAHDLAVQKTLLQASGMPLT